MAEFEVTHVNVGHGHAALIKIPDERYVLVDVYRCPGEGIDLFKLLDDVLPDGDDGQQAPRRLVDHARPRRPHRRDRRPVRQVPGRSLWLPQHGKKLQTVAGNYEEFERVQDEHPDDETYWPKGSRSVWTTLGDNGEVAVRCFSPPGYIDPEGDIDEEEAKHVVHENCVVLKFTYADYPC